MDARSALTGTEEVDLDLISHLAEGDEVALRRFYQRHGRFVYSLAMSVVHNQADAEEVTQETFWRVWQHAGRFDPERSTLKGWLAMVTRRIAIDRTRSRSFKTRGREVSVAGDALPAAENPAFTPDELHLSKHASRRVRQAVSDLDEPYRVLIQLSYFEGMTHSGMAAHLDTPLGTVKTRLREAIHQLRVKLEVEV